MIRYEIYQIMKKHGGTNVDNETREKQLNEISEVFQRKPKFREQSMEMYGVQKAVGDERNIENLMKEIYLDYYSKSI